MCFQAVKNDGQTALHEAAEAGQKDAVEYLLSVGANAQAQDEVRSIPLLCIVLSGTAVLSQNGSISWKES